MVGTPVQPAVPARDCRAGTVNATYDAAMTWSNETWPNGVTAGGPTTRRAPRQPAPARSSPPGPSLQCQRHQAGVLRRGLVGALLSQPRQGQGVVAGHRPGDLPRHADIGLGAGGDLLA